MEEVMHYVVSLNIVKVTREAPSKSAYGHRASQTPDEAPSRRQTEEITKFVTQRPTLRSAARLVRFHLDMLAVDEEPCEESCEELS